MLNVHQFLKEDGLLNLSKLTKSVEGKSFLCEAANLYGEARPAQLAYRVLYDIKEFPWCKGCKKQLTEKNFIDFNHGFRSYCSQSCSSKYGLSHESLLKMIKSKEFIDARREKIIAKYGTSSMICLNREKAKQTSLERYGVDQDRKSTRLNSSH